MHSDHQLSQRDLRYPTLVTALAILLFLPQLFLVGMLAKLREFAQEAGMELPYLSQLLTASPLATLLFAVFLMCFTIFFAWCRHKGALLSSLSLLLQGIFLGLIIIAISLLYFSFLHALL